MTEMPGTRRPDRSSVYLVVISYDSYRLSGIDRRTQVVYLMSNQYCVPNRARSYNSIAPTLLRRLMGLVWGQALMPWGLQMATEDAPGVSGTAFVNTALCIRVQTKPLKFCSFVLMFAKSWRSS